MLPSGRISTVVKPISRVHFRRLNSCLSSCVASFRYLSSCLVSAVGETGGLERLAAAVMLADVEGLYYAKVERLIKVLEAVGPRRGAHA